jgi:membrane-associated phospholipid phosphatase
LRALAVGAPTLGVLQGGIGSMRPQGDSRWHPFQSHHGVSGHTFVGAVPFLTAAAMSESYFLKALFFAGSFSVGWSRIHQDAHYVSQIAIGWGIAFLSVRAVNITEGDGFRMRLVPAEVADGVGIGVHVEY